MKETQEDEPTGGLVAPTPLRQIRAHYDDHTITVYQAYSDRIADRALEAGTFVSPFKRERMTWIKPSFLWMMYRCGWGQKVGQERVLAIQISREGLEWALAHSCLSHFERDIYGSEREWQARQAASPVRIQWDPERSLQSACAAQLEWQARQAASPVRIQWDPERSLQLGALPYRSIQVGLAGEAVYRYVQEWITAISDLTEQAHQVHQLVRDRELTAARAALPVERPYPLPDSLKAVVNAS